MEDRLRSLIASIEPVDCHLDEKIQAHLDNLTKPKGSLGRLEELAKRYALIKDSTWPELPAGKSVVVFAADHGVTEEGVSAFPKEVTFQMVRNFLAGGAGINVLARHAGAKVKVVDIGVDHDFPDLENLISRKVAYGTRNMVRQPALTTKEAVDAILAGADIAKAEFPEGTGLLATGEMGIGNTTAASAITAVLCARSPREVTGRGTGIAEDAYRHKIKVIEKALENRQPDPENPLDVLAKVGGLEIAGICGLILGAASRKIPVVIDGFISTAGAVVAKALVPHVTDYLFAGHLSVEAGHKAQMEFLGLRPLLDLDMRLGEGTGAVLAMGLIEAGIKIYREMATFDGARVSPGNEEPVRS